MARIAAVGVDFAPWQTRFSRRESFEVIVALQQRSAHMKRVLSVQSHVVHGYVGNKCATFPLQLLGYEVDAVNSVQFCCHTGYPTFNGSVLGGDDLDKLVDGLDANRPSRSFCYIHLNDLCSLWDVVAARYIGSATFLRSVLRLLTKLQEQFAIQGKRLCYVCDPVLGDNGKLYVPEELIEIYRRDVLPNASVATPNQFEIELLTGIKIESEDDAARACEELHKIGVPIVVVTTLDYALVRGSVLMMLSERRGGCSVQHIVEVPLLQARFTGSGDLTSALLLAWMTEHPTDLPLALEKTAASVYGVLEATTRRSPARLYGDRIVPPELDIIGSKSIIEHPPIRSEGGSRPFSPFLAAFEDDIASVFIDLLQIGAREDLNDIVTWLQTNNIPVTIRCRACVDTPFPAVHMSKEDCGLLPDRNGRLLYITDAETVTVDERYMLVQLLREHTLPKSEIPQFAISSLAAIRRFFGRLAQSK